MTDEMRQLTFDEFKTIQEHITKNIYDESVAIIDFRDRESTLNEGLIPGSINIHKNIPFERFIGQMVTPYSKIVLVSPEGEHDEIKKRLINLTYRNIIGYIEFKSWIKTQKPYFIDEITDLNKTNAVIDIREPWEWSRGVIETPNNIELIKLRMLWLNGNWTRLDPKLQYTLMCQSGVRSYISASYLYSKGFKVNHFKGGMERATKLCLKIIK